MRDEDRRSSPSGRIGSLVLIAFVLQITAPAKALLTLHGGDYNGDGRADLTVSADGEDLGSKVDAGAAHVLYGTGAGPSAAKNEIWSQDASGIAGGSETGDILGSALARGDFNGDGRADIALGASGEAIGSSALAGAVNVVYGSGSGLASPRNQLLYQGAGGVPGQSEAGDTFGFAVGAGDFDDDGFDDLATAAPFEILTSNGAVQGAVTVMYGTATGLTGSGSQVWTQASGGIADDPENGDAFGVDLASGDFNGDGTQDLAIGVPGETPLGDRATTQDTGAVAILLGVPVVGLTAAGSQLIAPADVPKFAGVGIGRAIAVGNFDGDGDSDLAVGVQLYSGTVDVGGAVETFLGSTTGIDAGTEELFEQGEGGISDSVEPYDNFGFSVAAGDFNKDGRDDLAAGAPFEDIGTAADAGSVNIIYGGASGLSGTGAQFLRQGSGVEGSAERGDQFGKALASGDYNGDGAGDLAVGTPAEDVGSITNAGCVNVIFGTSAPTGLAFSNDRLWTQDSAGVAGTAEKNDRFGQKVL